MFGRKKKKEAEAQAAAEKAEADKAIAEAEAKAKKKKAGPDLTKWLALSEGSIVVIHGVKCRLNYVNTGKRRLTFVPIDPLPMPRPLKTENPQYGTIKSKLGEQKVRVA